MTVYSIALPTDDDFASIETRLDGTAYALDLSWNQRAGLWYMSIFLPRATGARVPILLGKALLAQQPLMQGLVNDDRPAGELFVRAERDPRRYDWNTFAILMYFDRAEGFGLQPPVPVA